MRPVLSFLAVCAAGASALILTVYLAQRSMMYYTMPLDPESPGARAWADHAVAFERDGVTLRGWLLHPDSKTLLIYYGGNAEELSQSIPDFLAMDDVATLLVNYRGYGLSEGRPNERDLVADAIAIHDQVRDNHEQVVLVGRSLGSGIATQVAAARDPDAVILITPFDSMLNVARSLYPFLPVSLLLKDRYDSITLAPHITAPALFLIAADDRVIPYERSRALCDAWGGPTTWIEFPNTGHNSLSSHPDFPTALREGVKRFN